MGRVENTVFISYRRTNMSWALAIYQYLTARNYDVFFDYESINVGDFERVIMDNIASRAHFIVILTPSALERCASPEDWLRREIEYAIDMRRNIIPLMLDGFDFGSPGIANKLTGKLSLLKRYNALDIPSGYFFDAMERLKERWLTVPVDTVLHPLSTEAAHFATTIKRHAAIQPDVLTDTLAAEQIFEQGVSWGRCDQYAVRVFSEAIVLKPNFAEAYSHRGNAFRKLHRYTEALMDLKSAIRLKPYMDEAFYRRGRVYYALKQYNDALYDFNEAIRLGPVRRQYLFYRGLAYHQLMRYAEALQDYDEVLRMKPQDTHILNSRGVAHVQMGNWENAITDFQAVLTLDPDNTVATENLRLTRRRKPSAWWQFW
jgi:tetratricopeptide (TPR) repeat protein